MNHLALALSCKADDLHLDKLDETGSNFLVFPLCFNISIIKT